MFIRFVPAIDMKTDEACKIKVFMGQPDTFIFMQICYVMELIQRFKV